MEHSAINWVALENGLDGTYTLPNLEVNSKGSQASSSRSSQEMPRLKSAMLLLEIRDRLLPEQFLPEPTPHITCDRWTPIGTTKFDRYCSSNMRTSTATNGDVQMRWACTIRDIVFSSDNRRNFYLPSSRSLSSTRWEVGTNQATEKGKSSWVLFFFGKRADFRKSCLNKRASEERFRVRAEA